MSQKPGGTAAEIEALQKSALSQIGEMARAFAEGRDARLNDLIAQYNASWEAHEIGSGLASPQAGPKAPGSAGPRL